MTNLVTQILTGWNRMGAWLRQIAALQSALKSRTSNLMTRMNSFCAMAISASVERNDGVLLNGTVLSDLANLGEHTSRRQRQEGILTMYPVFTGWSGCVIALATWSVVTVAPSLNGQTTPAPPPRDQFTTANGVRLHYVDWGGKGETILFLAGLGATTRSFNAFASKFVDRFHALGLTRRASGLSGKPASGYATATLVADLKGFLDVMRIRRVTLIGHSMAGNEMTALAGLYPRRVTRLVYLDASPTAPCCVVGACSGNAAQWFTSPALC
jgi:hypothetical protein